MSVDTDAEEMNFTHLGSAAIAHPQNDAGKVLLLPAQMRIVAELRILDCEAAVDPAQLE